MKSLKLLLKKIEGEITPAEKFHYETRVVALDTKLSLSKIPQSWKTIHFKTYPRFKAYRIRQDLKKMTALIEVIKKRKSTRVFTGKGIDYEDLSCLLQYAAGMKDNVENTDDNRRMYPSAGARYPLEVYAIILNVKSLPKGLYHYNVKESYLETLLEQDFKKNVTQVFGGEEWVQNAAVIFVITGILNRSQIKYKERAYKFMLIETGHLSQNLCLLATELGLGVCPLGGYIDKMLEELLDIQFPKELTLYAIAIGKI